MTLTYADPPLQILIPPWQTNNRRRLESNSTESDELLLMMEQAVQQLPSTQKLQDLLAWVTQVAAQSEEMNHPAAKRAAALALVLERSISLAHAHARGVDRTSALELSNTLDLALNHARKIVARLKQSPHPEMASELPACELSREYTNHVTQSWFEGKFDPKLIELSQSEAQALNRYLYASEWMIQCTESPTGFSCRMWETIVDRLIQPSCGVF